MLCRKGPWDPCGPQTERGPAIAKAANSMWSRSRRTLDSRMKEVILPVYPALERYIRHAGSSAGLLITRGMDILETVPQRATKTVKGLDHLTFGERLRDLELPEGQSYQCV